jgi:hypothetical protein
MFCSLLQQHLKIGVICHLARMSTEILFTILWMIMQKKTIIWQMLQQE